MADAPPSDQPCGRLLDRLPSTVGNAVRREVEPAGVSAAAWGEPPLVLRCGVAVPDLRRQLCVEVERVGWVPYATTEDGATVFAAFGRRPQVTVTVPEEAPGGPTEPLVDLAEVVGSLPQHEGCY